MVRLVVERQYNLIALAMRTSEEPGEELKIEAVSASQIPLPLLINMPARKVELRGSRKLRNGKTPTRQPQ